MAARCWRRHVFSPTLNRQMACEYLAVVLGSQYHERDAAQCLYGLIKMQPDVALTAAADDPLAAYQNAIRLVNSIRSEAAIPMLEGVMRKVRRRQAVRRRRRGPGRHPQQHRSLPRRRPHRHGPRRTQKAKPRQRRPAYPQDRRRLRPDLVPSATSKKPAPS
mmetsp:Transcript_939/g.2689  ORF Transcript_939/g.2689 Transcript_939/m.2689 type:complete len:162 (+) Transcript_939:495-980(+)